MPSTYKLPKMSYFMLMGGAAPWTPSNPDTPYANLGSLTHCFPAEIKTSPTDIQHESRTNLGLQLLAGHQPHEDGQGPLGQSPILSLPRRSGSVRGCLLWLCQDSAQL